jgi:multiple sugar transport system substrate-binding protein
MARALTAIAVVLALAAVAACGAAGGGEDEGPGGRIDFLVTADAEEAAVYGDLVRAYREKSGEDVRMTPIPDTDGFLQRLSTAYAARRPPAVWLINHRRLGPYLREGAIDPAGPRLGTEGAPERDELLDVPVEAFTYRGELQCVPQNASNLVVYFNRDRFREAGVAVPSGDWTYDEMLAAARRLKGGGGHAVGTEASVIRVAPFVWSAGGELVDDDDNPTRFTFDTPDAQRGLDAFLALGRDGLSPSAADVAAKPLEERFIDGELAMFFSSRRDVPNFRAIEDFEWDVAGFPTIEREVTVLHADGFCLSAGPQADAGWRFIAFATGQEGQRILARGGRTVPSMRSVAESPDFLNPTEPPRSSKVFLDQLDVLRRLPTTRDFAKVEDAAGLALEAAFYGRISRDEMIERIARETDGQFGEGSG